MLLLHPISLVAMFAGLYHGFGLKDQPSVDWQTAIYFSLVTRSRLDIGTTRGWGSSARRGAPGFGRGVFGSDGRDRRGVNRCEAARLKD